MIRRSGYIKRYKPLNPVSAKRRARTKARQLVIEYVRERDMGCQFPVHVQHYGWTMANVLTMPVGCAGRLDCHEIAPRSVYPGGELDVDNVVLVCRKHHQWIDANPHTAWLLGLHKFSWETAA